MNNSLPVKHKHSAAVTNTKLHKSHQTAELCGLT